MRCVCRSVYPMCWLTLLTFAQKCFGCLRNRLFGFMLCVFEPAHEFFKGNTNDAAYLLQLKQVQASFANLILTNERLRLPEQYGQILLPETGFHANLSQQLPQTPLLSAGCVSRHFCGVKLNGVDAYSKMEYGRAEDRQRMSLHRQMELPTESPSRAVPLGTGQLLKWIGNKHRFAQEIVSYFPKAYRTYREPFLGSGAVLGALAPETAIGSDSFAPLIQIWQMLRDQPDVLKNSYAQRWHAVMRGNKVAEYERIKADYNRVPNGRDLLFLSRACYGGVVRFRKADGYMSTPCGIHDPISPCSFAKRVDEWRERAAGTTFLLRDYREAMAAAGRGDLIYCDPPYTFTQSILYGAQSFDLADLFRAIGACKKRGAFVVLSIDGTKRSGSMICDIQTPRGLFQREVMIHCGRSMLRRFQMNGRTLENEIVHDRLLLTY